MDYKEKYLKYKEKYLDLKNKNKYLLKTYNSKIIGGLPGLPSSVVRAASQVASRGRSEIINDLRLLATQFGQKETTTQLQADAAQRHLHAFEVATGAGREDAVQDLARFFNVVQKSPLQFAAETGDLDTLRKAQVPISRSGPDAQVRHAITGECFNPFYYGSRENAVMSSTRGLFPGSGTPTVHPAATDRAVETIHRGIAKDPELAVRVHTSLPGSLVFTTIGDTQREVAGRAAYIQGPSCPVIQTSKRSDTESDKEHLVALNLVQQFAPLYYFTGVGLGRDPSVVLSPQNVLNLQETAVLAASEIQDVENKRHKEKTYGEGPLVETGTFRVVKDPVMRGYLEGYEQTALRIASINPLSDVGRILGHIAPVLARPVPEMLKNSQSDPEDEEDRKRRERLEGQRGDPPLPPQVNSGLRIAKPPNSAADFSPGNSPSGLHRSSAVPVSSSSLFSNVVSWWQGPVTTTSRASTAAATASTAAAASQPATPSPRSPPAASQPAASQPATPATPQPAAPTPQPAAPTPSPRSPDGRNNPWGGSRIKYKYNK